MNVIFSWMGGAIYVRLWAFRAGLSTWKTPKLGRGKYTLAYVHWNDKILLNWRRK